MENILKNKTNFIFISPHLDDAIFSAGGLMWYLYNLGKKITIINVFTKASERPYTLSTKKFLYSCGYKNADDLFEDRIIEDAKVGKKINAKIINLNYIDALWRKRKNRGIFKFFANIIPEFNYVYPVYRLSIAKGKISGEDKLLEKKLRTNLGGLLDQNKDTAIFGTAGIGNHTDHLIVRNALKSLRLKNIIYWSDYPYSETANISRDFEVSQKLKRISFKTNALAKEKLVLGYKSQIAAIFGSNKINTGIEHYYVN